MAERSATIELTVIGIVLPAFATGRPVTPAPATRGRQLGSRRYPKGRLDPPGAALRPNQAANGLPPVSQGTGQQALDAESGAGRDGVGTE